MTVSHKKNVLKSIKKEILYGIHPVMEALNAGRREVLEIFVAKSRTPHRLKAVLNLARRNNISVDLIPSETLAAMAGTDQHQGICARTSSFPFVDLDAVAGGTGSENAVPFLLLLDNIEDPHNLGALVRTALCVGVNGVILLKDRAVSPTPTVSKASAGALEHMPIARVTNMARTLQQLKSRGIWIAGLSAATGQSVFDADLSVPLGIVIGSEGRGIRPLVQKNCDLLLSVPQTGPLDSLNASVAGAVVMYEAFRQRRCQRQQEKGRMHGKRENFKR